MHLPYKTAPSEVHATLKKSMLIDGFDVVFDIQKSQGPWLHDARSGTDFLDLFSFFASLPVSYDHPGMGDPAYLEKLHAAATYKPTNSDLYTEAMADFVSTFRGILPAGFEHLFFVEGGALAVENALKAAFDWKVRKNIARGRSETLGSQILHFKDAFHGRSGYTLSLTNTFDPRKTQYFPKFPWPRVPAPGLRFPVDAAEQERVATQEQISLSAIKEAVQKNPHDIAAIIIETIQGEGGDVHFRTEFLQALRDLCDSEEIMLIFDEVQAGMGLTGRWWAFENHGVSPDLFSFGKKTQVCGFASTGRIDEIDGVFKVPSRINSTWGGGLVDMVRCERYIQVIHEGHLLKNAVDVGNYARAGLRGLSEQGLPISNVRGRGLMCAFDLPTPEMRDQVRRHLYQHGKTIMLACGSRSVRFRPVLDFRNEWVDVAVERIANSVKACS